MIDPAARLDALRRAGLERSTRLVRGAQGPRVELDGREVMLLCANDYLGLAADPRVRDAAAEAAWRWGAGAGASRLVSGSMEPHAELEARLAAFERRERAVLFGSGYLANCGVVAALAGRGDVVLSDELNHASLVDGCRLSRAEVMVYRHGDLDHLGWLLARARGRAALVATDGVFSMDGDVAPLAGIVEHARRAGVRVLVDEAHGTGCLGPGGRGAAADAGVEDEVDVLVGTLGKALGSYGAYAACAAPLADWLVNAARPFIFSTAPPPPSLGAALAALDVLEGEPERRARLEGNARRLRAALARRGLATGTSTTQILPLVVGDAGAAVAAAARALARGVFAQAIRPPTVPAGTSRLRLAVSSEHLPEELERAADVLAAALAQAPAAAA